MKRKELAQKVLELIGGTAMTVADIIATIIESPYGSSYGMLARNLAYRERGRNRKEIGAMLQKRLYDLIYRLRRDGLIEKKPKRDSRGLLLLTRRGKEWISAILPQKTYAKQEDTTIKIVMFDVPEVQKRKRAWLRRVLRDLDFRMLQKSVWVGKAKIPQDLLHDLHKLDLLDHVEIVAVTKTGSLRHLM